MGLKRDDGPNYVLGEVVLTLRLWQNRPSSHWIEGSYYGSIGLMWIQTGELA